MLGLGLLAVASAVRDGVEIHAALGLASARRHMSRTVPLKVNAAIRKANGLAASHLKLGFALEAPGRTLKISWPPSSVLMKTVDFLFPGWLRS